MDNLETIQYLNMEENPVGRGKEDAALVIESPDFSNSWANLVESIWSEGIPLILHLRDTQKTELLTL